MRMKIALFYHSLLSDWNHGNAHFLRGIVTELQVCGHDVRVFEPQSAWSLVNLIAQHGEAPIREFFEVYPHLRSIAYALEELDLDRALDLIDLVIVHEWNEANLVQRIGAHRKLNTGYKLLFHDTHHGSVTDAERMVRYDLSAYDGVLAYGEAIRGIYLSKGWTQRAWTWHEAADTRIFHPIEHVGKEGDLIWIGNWGDEERSAELQEFVFEPVKALGLQARVYGVRYPEHAREMLAAAAIDYGGWLPNYRVPQAFAQFKVTVHIPRRPYVKALPGIPTIRPFEALACGIPLVCSPWEDVEHLFTDGEDFLIARNGQEMRQHLYALLHDRDMARALATHGRQTILQRHTCAHRIDELMHICQELGLPCTSRAPQEPSSPLPSRPTSLHQEKAIPLTRWHQG
jgi:spore maturation protein CgeB